MKRFRFDLLSNVYRSPDDPVIDPPADDAPPAPAAIDPPADDPVEPPAPAPEPKPSGTPWYMQRLAEESAKVTREREGREAAERRASDAEALAERLQQAAPDPAAPKPQTAPAARQPQAQPDFDKAVDQAAEYKLFVGETQKVKARGLAAFPDFAESLNILTAIGATNDGIVQDILAADQDNAHVLLDKLAKDPERAVSLTQMDPRRRIAELTRMSAAIAPKVEVPKPALAPAPPVSRAPKPAPALAPVGGDDDAAPLGDDVDDATWSANWDRTHKKRA